MVLDSVRVFNEQPLEKLVPSTIALAHPFVHRVDVVFQADEELAHELQSLSGSCYHVADISLATVFDLEFASGTQAVGFASFNSEDSWRLDGRGNLALIVQKDTYETLSLVGKPIANKGQFGISIDLRDRTTNAYTSTKRACIRWDEARARQGIPGWDALFLCSGVADLLGNVREIKANVTMLSDIWVPLKSTVARSESEDALSWREEMSALFEWAGLVGLSSPRLSISDRVDSYVSTYEPPSGSSSGKAMHMAWDGLVSQQMVVNILTTVKRKVAGIHIVVLHELGCKDPYSLLLGKDGWVVSSSS